MEADFDISRLLALRSLTTTLAELFSKQLREQLANLAILLQPRSLLGELIRYEKSAVKGQDATFQELLKLYQPLARATALNLQTELKAPLDLFSTTPDIVPATYSYKPQGSNKTITVTTPLKWVLCYKDLGPQRLRELIVAHARSSCPELQGCVLHYLAMYMLIRKRPGIAPVFDALRFPVTSHPNEELAGLPFVYICAPISTMRPPDTVILQSTQISGSTSFEEVVNVDDVAKLSDPIKEQLLTLVKEHDGEPVRAIG